MNTQQSSIQQLIGQQVGNYTIVQVILLDYNTALICCNDTKTETGTSHMEAEHWRDENTFHYNNLFYDAEGNFIESEPVNMKPQNMRTFERLFASLSN